MPITSSAQRPPKAAMLIAQRIVQDAIRAGHSEGDLLDPEKVMLEKYQIGRGTLREGLRLLEFQGVIGLKPGPGGGPVLHTPKASQLGSTLVLLMQMQSAPFRSIVEVRTAIEPVLCGLAAALITDEQLTQLRSTIDQMSSNADDLHSFIEAHKRFHDVVALSANNALFRYVVEALLSIMDGTPIGFDYPHPRREVILKAHQDIYEALEARDPDRSTERMRRHVEAYERYAEHNFPQVMADVIPWGQRYIS